MKLTGTVAALQNGEGAAALRKRIAEQEAKAAEARAAYLRETAGGNDALQRHRGEKRGACPEPKRGRGLSGGGRFEAKGTAPEGTRGTRQVF